MDITSTAAAVFLVAVAPICGFVIFSDLARMKIPNVSVYALVIAYAVLGPFVLDFQVYLSQWLHLVVLLILGIAFNAAGLMGAGDAKFIAAAGPYLAINDFRMIIILYCAALLGAVTTHRLIKLSPLKERVPHWESWHRKRDFPMGFALGMTLVLYLAWVALGRV
ncbi:MAG: prepilin peptidase [Pseudomonadota bacterium]